MLTVGSLFAGIGGFDLGLERAGMRTVWFCEQDPFCQRVLAKHWPGVPCHSDVRALVADTDDGVRRSDAGSVARLQSAGEGTARLGPIRERDGSAGPDGSSAGGAVGSSGRPVPVPVPYVDVLCGGFPCQDLSYAGKGAGLDGERSGLWSEYARVVRELRPRYVVVENVSALLARGLGTVLGDLAACGYDAEWDCVPASAVGAPHRRDRVWLVGYPNGSGLEGRRGHDERPGERAARASGAQPAVGNADGAPPNAYAAPSRSWRAASESGWWSTEPDVGRVANGVPARVDRLRALGNALVPQIAEWIGRRILEHEEGALAA